MKRILKNIVIPALLTALLVSCHKINVPINTELTPGVFPQNSDQFVQASGPAYVALRGNISVEHFFLQTLTTDEAIFPARGGNWFNGGEFQQLHYHTWTKDHAKVNEEWYWCSTIIGTVNQTIAILQKNIPDGTAKQTNIAELKMVRALAYFWMMDSYGNIPIDTLSGNFSSHPNVPRAQVFDFIDADIKSALPYLATTVDISTYGRATRYTAQALLAKMYLNAEYYTGTPRYNECIVACDDVISSGKFALEPAASYLKMFYPENGPQMQEFIFSIPFDPSVNGLGVFRSQNLHARYDVPRGLKGKYGLPFTPDAAVSTLPEYYAHFNDQNDVRNQQWLTGPQFYNDGVTPVLVTTTNKGYDQFYTGSDPAGAFTYQIDLKPQITLRQDIPSFDVGNDEIGWNMGYRNVKIFPDATSSNRNQKNDIPIFRYSDIILMKAEALLRGGTATLGHTALSLVNSLRSVRTTSAPLAGITLDGIYAERCREFAWESWHRNDMIRFSKYESSYGFKTNTETYRRIFPIPTSALALNPDLVQNPGY